MQSPMKSRRMAALALGTSALLPDTAHAGLMLSRAVVDIQPTQQMGQDVEIWNDSGDTSYVVAQPSEITAPGQPTEQRVTVDDPAAGGLLVSPQRLVLQPHERKLIRIAAVDGRRSSDRIWRVIVKPVAGPVTAPVTALKLLIGYDLLVILRPTDPKPDVTGVRQGNLLTLHNSGNTNVEVYEGKICAVAGSTNCPSLPSMRIYAGASWQQTLPGDGAVEYRITSGTQTSVKAF